MILLFLLIKQYAKESQLVELETIQNTHGEILKMDATSLEKIELKNMDFQCLKIMMAQTSKGWR